MKLTPFITPILFTLLALHAQAKVLVADYSSDTAKPKVFGNKVTLPDGTISILDPQIQINGRRTAFHAVYNENLNVICGLYGFSEYTGYRVSEETFFKHDRWEITASGVQLNESSTYSLKSVTCVTTLQAQTLKRQAEQKRSDAAKANLKPYGITGYCGYYSDEDGQVLTDTKGKFIEAEGDTPIEAYQRAARDCHWVEETYILYTDSDHSAILHPKNAVARKK